MAITRPHGITPHLLVPTKLIKRPSSQSAKLKKTKRQFHKHLLTSKSKALYMVESQHLTMTKYRERFKATFGGLHHNKIETRKKWFNIIQEYDKYKHIINITANFQLVSLVPVEAKPWHCFLKMTWCCGKRNWLKQRKKWHSLNINSASHIASAYIYYWHRLHSYSIYFIHK